MRARIFVLAGRRLGDTQLLFRTDDGAGRVGRARVHLPALSPNYAGQSEQGLEGVHFGSGH